MYIYFKDAVSLSDYIVLIGGVMNCKGCGRKQYGLIDIFIWLEGLRKSMRNLSHDSQCPGHIEIRHLLIQVIKALLLGPI
jgi:hypothetical protein